MNFMFHVCRRGFDILLRETSFSLIPFSLPLHIFFVASSSCLEQHEQYLTWHAFHNKKFFLPQSRKGLPLLFILYPLSFFDQEYIAVSVSWTSCHRSLVLFVSLVFPSLGGRLPTVSVPVFFFILLDSNNNREGKRITKETPEKLH